MPDTPVIGKTVRSLGPGLLLSTGVALAAWLVEPAIKAIGGGKVGLPTVVIALIIGIMLFPMAQNPTFRGGIDYAVKTLLRYAIALLGLRIALGDIVALGLGAGALVLATMAMTIAAAMLIARILSREAGFGALAGAANAVCGASATLATATVVPDYKGKSADIAFTVVMANVLSTIVMLAYPPLCAALGFSAQETGLMLGLTIHDMAQVVGAGYAVSEEAGNSAVIVKLFRVFLLLPAVLAIGWWFSRQGASTGEARVPVPGFALAFVGFCALNSVLPASPLAEAYGAIRVMLVAITNWGMLIAIAALGLGTSLGAILSIGWRHMAVFCGATIVILVIGTGGIFLLR